MAQVVPLELLSSGEEGEILEIDGERDLVNRLAEMGFREGVRIRMIRSGSPCIVAVGNHRLSLRADQSAVVLVTVGGARD